MNRNSLFYFLAGLALAALLFPLGWLAGSRGSHTPEPEIAAADVAPAEAPLVQPDPSPHAAEDSATRTEILRFRTRDSAIAMLLRQGVQSSTALAIVGALRDAGAELRKVRPGDRLHLTRDAQGDVVAVAYAANAWLRFDANEGDSGWQAERIELEPQVRIEPRHGEVRSSLWELVDSGALAPAVLLDLVEMFEYQFDFTMDTRPGDRFRLLVEARYADGARVDYGRILAAQYASGGRTLTGVGFRSRDGFRYFDGEGRSLKRAFLRSPLKFTRISSGFTYRRPHPILGGVRPHLAIDYAAPTGTPVWAVADGVVQFAGRKGGNGIQVLLRHRSGYKTYYNHLSRVARGVRAGMRVKQKQVIGHVGSTGLSTGPHLDYRVSRNGRFVNPLGERFIPGKPIVRGERAQFLAHTRALIERLENEAPL